MKYRIASGKEPNLILTVSKAEQKALQRDMALDTDGDRQPGLLHSHPFHTDDYLVDLLEYVTCNGLTWCRPEQVGALTDAPMLCEGLADDGRVSGMFWAFMSYQVRSVQQDLAEYGKAVFQFGGVSIVRVTDIIIALQAQGTIPSSTSAFHKFQSAFEELGLDVHNDVDERVWKALSAGPKHIHMDDGDGETLCGRGHDGGLSVPTTRKWEDVTCSDCRSHKRI